MGWILGCSPCSPSAAAPPSAQGSPFPSRLLGFRFASPRRGAVVCLYGSASTRCHPLVPPLVLLQCVRDTPVSLGRERPGLLLGWFSLAAERDARRHGRCRRRSRVGARSRRGGGRWVLPASAPTRRRGGFCWWVPPRTHRAGGCAWVLTPSLVFRGVFQEQLPFVCSSWVLSPPLPSALKLNFLAALCPPVIFAYGWGKTQGTPGTKRAQHWRALRHPLQFMLGV